MSDRLLLDTHIALWLDSGSERLRAATVALIDRCWRGGGTVYLSAVTAWEIALLADTRRIMLDLPAAGWVERFLSRPGVEAAPLSHQAAARTYEWPALEHRDPADRMLIATALELDCPLVTYDERIAEFGRGYDGGRGLAVVH